MLKTSERITGANLVGLFTFLANSGVKAEMRKENGHIL